MIAKISQRNPTDGHALPNSTCAPDLFSRLDQLQEVDPAVAWGPVRAALGFLPPHAAGAGVVREGPIWSIRGDSWVANIHDKFGPKKPDALPVRIGKAILVDLFLALVWVAALASEIWISRPGGPGSCPSKGAKSIKADIQAKELVGMFTARSAEWATRVDYIGLDYLCPSKIPDVGVAVAGYLADAIDQKSMVDYCRANGYCEQTVGIMAETQRARHDQQSLADLRHRGIIQEDSWLSGMRELGWLGQPQADTQFLLTYFWPDPVSTVDWGRRRVTDADWVDRAGLDKDWERFWDGEIKKYLEGKGVKEDEAKRLLRSSYQMLDQSTAADLFRRGLAGMLPPGTNFDAVDFQRSIDLSTVPPAYRGAVQALAFSPLGFRQLRTLFDESIIDADAVGRYLVAGGFTPNDASLLVAEWVKLKPAYFRHKIGAGGAANFGKAFAAGLMGTTELANELRLEGFTPPEIKAAIAEARAERLRLHRQDLIKYLKARYLKGTVDETQVQAVLASTNLDAEDIGDLLRFWRTEFEVNSRQSSTAELVGWYKQGIMPQQELANALAQLRYSAADSARIIAAADYDQATANLKTAEKLVSEATRGLSRDVKEWRDMLKNVEKLHGTVAQRTLTEPGKLLGWITKRVLKKPKEVSEMLSKGAVAGDLEAVNGAATEEYFAEPEGPASSEPTPPA